nr:hypothetical protein [Treponema sp.]
MLKNQKNQIQVQKFKVNSEYKDREKVNRNLFIVIVINVILIFATGSFISCEKKLSAPVLQGLDAEIERFSSDVVSIVEVENAIKKYYNDVTFEGNPDNISKEQMAALYKVLGIRYLDSKFYDKALAAFQKSVEYDVENENLYYYMGLSAGYLSAEALKETSSDASVSSFNYIKLAESSYLKSLDINKNYAPSLYGLACLYRFSFDDSAKCIPYLERLLNVSAKDYDAMMVLAGAYFDTYQ